MKKVLAMMLMMVVFLCGCQVRDKATHAAEYHAGASDTTEYYKCESIVELR